MDNTRKFDGRAEVYVKARPGYAPALFDCLREKLPAAAAVADIGAGTGKFTAQLLEAGFQVCAVEPNADMRAAAEALLGGAPGFTSAAGDASHTGLGDHSVDGITTAQAFHWFDPDAFRAECRRILKPGGLVVLVWNFRTADAPVHRGHADLCRAFCLAFQGFSGGITEDRISAFFGGVYEKVAFPNDLTYTKEGFIARTLSASYALTAEDPQYEAFLAALGDLFDRYAQNGLLTLPNETIAYIGRV